MGTPLPPLPFEPGELCISCWGDNGVFGEITPRVISIQLFDLEHGQAWEDQFENELLTPTDLEQNPSFPCFFNIFTANFLWTVAYDGGQTFVQVEKRFGFSFRAFVGLDVAPCILETPNSLITPVNTVTFNGTASIYLGGV